MEGRRGSSWRERKTGMGKQEGGGLGVAAAFFFKAARTAPNERSIDMQLCRPRSLAKRKNRSKFFPQNYCCRED